MKRVIKNSVRHIFLIAGMVVFFAMGSALAQNPNPNAQCQRFTQCDLNGDGFIGANEVNNGQFAQFDKDGDGLLTRNEFRAMNRAQNNTGNAAGPRKMNNNGQGIGNRQGTGNGQGQGIRQQNKTRTPQANCPQNNTGTRRGRS